MGRVDDDRNVPPFQFTRHLDAGARLEVNIQDGNVRGVGRQPLYSVSTGKWAGSCIALIFQIIGEVHANSGIALDD